MELSPFVSYWRQLTELSIHRDYGTTTGGTTTGAAAAATTETARDTEPLFPAASVAV